MPGWGAKSAAAVLSRYGHLDDVPPKASTWEVPGIGGSRAMTLAASLRDHWTEALLYRDLARLRSAEDGVKDPTARCRGPPLGRSAEARMGGVLRGMGPRPSPVKAPPLARGELRPGASAGLAVTGRSLPGEVLGHPAASGLQNRGTAHPAALTRYGTAVRGTVPDLILRRGRDERLRGRQRVLTSRCAVAKKAFQGVRQQGGLSPSVTAGHAAAIQFSTRSRRVRRVVARHPPARSAGVSGAPGPPCRSAGAR